MITTPAYLQIIKKLPPMMQRLINHDGLVDLNISLVEKYRLNGQQQRAMMEIEASIIAQEYPPAVVLDHVSKDIGLQPARAKQFAADFLGFICLPMQWYIGSVEALIQQLGGNVAQYQSQMMNVFGDLFGQPKAETTTAAAAATPATPQTVIDHPVLRNFDERVASFKGRAEVLLRLTGLSSEVEEAMKAKKISQAEGEALLQQLDGLSYAVNTKDLNALEIQALRRGITKVLKVLAKAGSST